MDSEIEKKLDSRSLENEEEEDFQIWNLGIPGEDSRQLLERMDEELERRIYQPMQRVIILQIGCNDIQYLEEKDENRIAKEEFRENLEKLVNKSREYAEKVVLISEAYITIDGPIPWAEEKELSDERLQKYVEIQRQVAREKKVRFIDLRKEFSKKNWEKVLKDGCHPDGGGHRKICREVEKKLSEEEVI
jgi:lysophospholipase L1-like esterase